MRIFSKNTKGAVTVFVSLLLIPAMLVSGTAVDIARIHTARSIVQDANQLAANAVFTQYDALLKDMYGIYGVMEDDPILGGMLLDYVNLSVFGDAWQDRSLGTFQLFYGSNLREPVVTPEAGKNLRNPDVLLRQIQEYEKLRAPVVFLDEVKILSIIDNLKHLMADTLAIGKKMDIDDKIDALFKQYEKVYKRIKTIDEYADNMNSSMNKINDCMKLINEQLQQLKTTRDQWTSAHRDDDSDKMSDYEKKYSGILNNIKSIVTGGSIKSNWKDGESGDDGEWVSGYWRDSYSSPIVLNTVIRDLKTQLNSYETALQNLLTDSKSADRLRRSISNDVESLDGMLGNCSKAFKEGMNAPVNGKSMMDHYRNLAKYDIEAMANAVIEKTQPLIDEARGVLEDVETKGYGKVNGITLTAPTVSRTELTPYTVSVFGSPFPISLIITNENHETSLTDRLAQLVGVNYKYTFNWQFLHFENNAFNSTQNREFYDELVEMFENEENKKTENDIRSSMLGLANKAQLLFQRMTLQPQGADYYQSESTEQSGSFGNNKDWSKKGEANAEIQDAINPDGDFTKTIGQLAVDFIVEKLLLLTYETKMFSNFTTRLDDKTMSGIPMNTTNNYFYQSEQEYLFNGSTTAGTNLAVVGGWIFLIRFVCNVISAFIIPEVFDTIMAITDIPVIGIVLGPFVMILWVLAESAVDVYALFQRQKVPLLKMKFEEWYLGAGLPKLLLDLAIEWADLSDLEKVAKGVGNLSDLESAAEGVEGATGGKLSLISGPRGTSIDVVGGEEGTEIGVDLSSILKLKYSDYMWILLLFKGDKDLTYRTADLISLNITNVKQDIRADEATMSSAVLFDMEKAFTDFRITTDVDMKLLFLSMPFVQSRASGMPGTIAVSVTDYRGY